MQKFDGKNDKHYSNFTSSRSRGEESNQVKKLVCYNRLHVIFKSRQKVFGAETQQGDFVTEGHLS